MSDSGDNSRSYGSLGFAARAFRHRNYRLFFAGQGTSLIGTWMQQVAMSWLVYRLTGLPSLLGLVGFISMMPMFFMTSVAGVFIDRWNRRRLLLATNALAMIQASVLSILTLTGHIAVWHVIVLGFFLGIVNAFDMPTRQSFVIEMVERKEDLNNAIALNSAMFNGARLVGPAVAGLAVAAFGEGICFLLNALSFVAIIIALLSMRVNPKPRTSGTGKPFEGFRQGYRYAFGFMPIRYCLLLLTVMNFIGMQYATLMPVFAKDVLHGGAHTQGFLVSASGAGALVAALYMASRKNPLGLEKLAPASLAFFACATLGYSASHNTVLSCALMIASGVGMMMVLISCNTIIQSVVEEDKRGRVMSFHAMATLGTMPFGSLLAGTLATHIGAPYAVALAAACCLVGSLFFALKSSALRTLARPVYVAHGIIRERPAEG
jgi:MFS family permease